jgi:hypothetical protein
MLNVCLSGFNRNMHLFWYRYSTRSANSHHVEEWLDEHCNLVTEPTTLSYR